MFSMDPVIARLNAQFENDTTLPAQSPKPNYHYSLGPNAGPLETTTPSRSNASPSSTLVSSTTSLNDDSDYGAKHFMDFAATTGQGSKYTAAFQPKCWFLVKDHEFLLPKQSPYELPFVDFNNAIDHALKAEKRPTNLDAAMSPSVFPLKKPWAAKFKEALQAKGADARARCTYIIVRSVYPWNEDEIFDLVCAIVWGASDQKICNANEHFASISLALYRSFSDLWPKDGLEKQFARVLSDVVVGTFLNSWSSESHRAIVYDPTLSVSRAQFVVSSLAHCKFVGSLYQTRLLSRQNLVGCVRAIFNNSSTIDHLLAVHHLLFYAGTRLWKECPIVSREMADLKLNIIKASRKIDVDRSLLPHRHPFNTVKSAVGYMLAQLDGYAQFLKQ